MEHTQPRTLFAIIAMALLMPGCRSTKSITTTQQDQTTTATQISTQDTTTTQNTQYHEKQSQQPRASPNLKLILYIILATIALLLILKWSIRQ